MSDGILLRRGLERRSDPDADLRALAEKGRKVPKRRISSERGGGEDWEAPLDLRVARPRASDLRAVWSVTGVVVPTQLAGALGATRPVLVTHVVTPFPVDGRSPARVWGLGYEFVAHDIDANTMAVQPSSEEYKVAELGQTLELGINAAGRFSPIGPILGAPFGVRASTSQEFQFEASLAITLRKVVGAPVGIGGAQWKMFRQNEPLDQPHTLLQLLLVPEEARELRCTVKAWAKQAGWLGTTWGAKYWPYDDQAFTVRLS